MNTYDFNSLGNLKYRLYVQAYLREITEIVENSNTWGQQQFAEAVWDDCTKKTAYKTWKDVRRLNHQTLKPARMTGIEEAIKMAEILGENYEYLTVVARANLASGKYPDLLNIFFNRENQS